MTISAVSHLLAALDEELLRNEAEFARLINLQNSIDIANRQGENEQIFRELQVLFAKQTAIQRERLNIENSRARIDDPLARKKILASKMLAISSAAKSECHIYERETNAFTC